MCHVFEERRVGAGGLSCLKSADLGQGVSGGGGGRRVLESELRGAINYSLCTLLQHYCRDHGGCGPCVR